MMARSLALALILSIGGAAHAADKPAVEAKSGWVRVLPGNLPAGGYVTFENRSDRALSIVGAASPQYGNAMIHRSSTDGGMGRMEMVDSVPLPAKGSLAFAPGGYHVMLMQPKQAVKPGDKIVVTFTLSDGETIPATLLARPANASGPTD
ncbi:copper chaperone PCu(A)C [Luteibacter jiangsuensis]|uniref:Copper chaperone PCu(A)C n=1 Tax=Luteibacter jiangsuensis TaxID=637577 RepID=A0ABX0Q621_9GAMM|nr:copper chaperone PCu(A)C [Luteibacter jiangsuensis]NID05256.1 copper chaperone PCu(A)C [Luteibacter jiangsuensis]